MFWNEKSFAYSWNPGDFPLLCQQQQQHVVHWPIFKNLEHHVMLSGLPPFYLIELQNKCFPCRHVCSEFTQNDSETTCVFRSRWVYACVKLLMPQAEGTLASGGSRISHRRGMDLVGGGVYSRDGCILKILYVKMKESGPLGGVCRAHPP